jgi:hypothetical protein
METATAPSSSASRARFTRSSLRWAAALGLAAVAAGASPAAAVPASACGKAGYSYAGFASAERVHGVRARLQARTEPVVASGHVAGWVGVSGPNGAGAWLQVGISAVAGVDDSSLYFEVARPGDGPRYTALGDVRPGETYDVAVLEIAGRPGAWRVWVNGAPRTQPIVLAGSSGRWRPIATAETWDGGRRVCNRFDFRFGRVQVAGSPGGSWRTFARGQRFEDPGYRLVVGSAASFRAVAAR